MEARRKTASTEVNYLKPRKSNQFSPSPIKRYHKGAQNSQTSTLPNTRALQTKQQSKVLSANEIAPDFKENENFFQQVSQKLLSKRPMRVLRQIENEMKCPNNSSEAKDIFPHSHLLKQDKIEINSLPYAPVYHTPSPQQLKSQDSAVKSEETKPSTLRKRDIKLTRKQAEAEQEEEKKQLDPSLDIPLLQEDRSRTGHDPQLIKNLMNANNPEQMAFSYPKLSYSQCNSVAPNQQATSSDGQLDSNGMQYQGRWTEEEHQKFLDGLKMFGKDWRSIEEYIGSRTCAQIRSHAQKYFNKLNRDKTKCSASMLGSMMEQSKVPQKQVKKTLTVRPAEPEEVRRPTPIKTVPKQLQGPVTKMDLIWHTNQQITQILQSIQRHQQEDFVLKMRSLIAEREYISRLYLIDHAITESEAVQRLIPIADQFDMLAKEVLLTKQSKPNLKLTDVVDLCNRMINERNLSQLACITLSSKIAVLPNPDQKRQIITHVYHSTGPQTEEEPSEKRPDAFLPDSESLKVKAWTEHMDSKGVLCKNSPIDRAL